MEVAGGVFSEMTTQDTRLAAGDATAPPLLPPTPGCAQWPRGAGAIVRFAARQWPAPPGPDCLSPHRRGRVLSATVKKNGEEPPPSSSSPPHYPRYDPRHYPRRIPTLQPSYCSPLPPTQPLPAPPSTDPPVLPHPPVLPTQPVLPHLPDAAEIEHLACQCGFRGRGS